MQMPGRTFSGNGIAGADYRYGHNQQENQNEIFKGAYSAESWMYDSRLGRRWEKDPITKPFESPYSTFGDNPIIFVDGYGLDWFYYQAIGETSPSWHWNNQSKIMLITGQDVAGKPIYTMISGHKAVVVFRGNRAERLGAGGIIGGNGSVNANVTVYGPGGAEDIQEYTGYSMTSGGEGYAIDEGIYPFTREDNKQGDGHIPKHYKVNTHKIPGRKAPADALPLGAENTYPGRDSPNYKTGIYMHASGERNFGGGKVSVGCLIIVKSEYDDFDRQLKPVGNGNEFLLILEREGSNHNPMMIYPTEKAVESINPKALQSAPTYLAPGAAPAKHFYGTGNFGGGGAKISTPSYK